MKPLINICIYQLIWFVCILWENTYVWICLPLLILHFAIFANRKADLRLMAYFLLIGMLIDGTLHIAGFYSFNAASTPIPIPLWLMFIWCALATLPHHSLAWMKNRLLLASLFGAVGGPLAYWAGVRLGAVSLNLPLPHSLAVLALIWALLWPALMLFAKRADGTAIPPDPGEKMH